MFSSSKVIRRPGQFARLMLVPSVESRVTQNLDTPRTLVTGNSSYLECDGRLDEECPILGPILSH